jgi:hypothetical protein
VILEVAILFWFVARLWQRASETVWYERWRVAQAHAPQPFSSLLPLAPAAAPVSSTPL